MAHLTYFVVRQPGGWAVEHGDAVLCCYRTQEQAVAKARLMAREKAQPCTIEVQEATGRFRTEAEFGTRSPAV